MQTRPPHSVKALEVEPRSDEVQLRKDVVVSPKEEASSAVTLFEETNDWLDKCFAQTIKVLGRIGGH